MVDLTYKPFVLILLLFLKYVEPVQKTLQLLDTIEDCNLPADKISPEGILPHTVIVVQHSPYEKIIRGNVTLPKKTLPIIYNARTYKMVNSKKVSLYNIEGLTCKNPLITMALKLIKFKSDDDCSGLPGIYTFHDISENKFRKSEFIVLPPGQYIYEFELTTQKGTILCFQCKLNVEKH